VSTSPTSTNYSNITANMVLLSPCQEGDGAVAKFKPEYFGASGFRVGYPSEIPAGNKDNPPLWKRITVHNLAQFRYPQALALNF
jgi:hypothetical protein